MMINFSILVSILSAASYVSAHGLIWGMNVNDKNFPGTGPGSGGGPSVIRQVSSQNPNYGASNPALTCGVDEQPATLIADAMPGDKLSFQWLSASKSNWPHNTGPILTYLASCGDGGCASFDATQAKWFKIDQLGKKADNSGNWVQQDVMNGALSNTTLPSNLAPGEYLVRHEIIALHLAVTKGMAEFYPGCAQIRVGGTQTGKPQDSELVSFPGGYSDDDPGIFDPNVFNPGAPYTFPGPPIASFVTGASTPDNGDSNGNTGSGSTPTKTSSQPANPTKTGKSGSCKLKKRAAIASNADEVVNFYKPRHASRIMRRLAFGESH